MVNLGKTLQHIESSAVLGGQEVMQLRSPGTCWGYTVRVPYKNKVLVESFSHMPEMQRICP